MKKIILLVLWISMLSVSSKAQFVQVRDVAVKNFISFYFPNCISGWNIDTVLAATTIPAFAPQFFTLGGFNQTVHSPYGLQFFDHLDSLNCLHNIDTIDYLPKNLKALRVESDSSATIINQFADSLQSLQILNCPYITNLPPLPNHLKRMIIDLDLALVNLPQLPTTLKFLEIGFTPIQTLPSLPQGLRFLEIGHDSLSLPTSLPDSLRYLELGWNNLSTIPTLPNYLNTFGCEANPISVVPNLPLTIEYLYIDFTNITSLPPLPPNLISLYCRYNNIQGTLTIPGSVWTVVCHSNSIDNISFTSTPVDLYEIDCTNNLLTSLPPLGNHLQVLSCDSNLLTTLPDIPTTCYHLSCIENPIQCLPALPYGLLDFYFPNSVTCLPNIISPSSYSPNFPTTPVCGMYNSSGCPYYSEISGHLEFDPDTSCSITSHDIGLQYMPVQLIENGQVQQTVIGKYLGDYGFVITPANHNYVLKIDTSLIPFQLLCSGDTLHADITAQDSIDANNDFFFACPYGFDYGLQAIATYGTPRAGNNIWLDFKAGNIFSFRGVNACTGGNADFVVSLGSSLKYVQNLGFEIPSYISPNQDTIIWYNVPFDTASFDNSFSIKAQVDSSVIPGTQLCISATIPPTTGDLNFSNNSTTRCLIAVNSYDPNFKEVYPIEMYPNDDWLTYTIHFQNTGNAAAQHIKVMDTLSNFLDPLSFQLLDFSFPPVIQIVGNEITFNFINIWLPDSTSNEPASHGYVQFKIRKQSGLPVGTTIPNSSSIYFDFNPPVVTNTAVTTIISSVNSVEDLSSIKIFPNPATDQLSIAGISSTTEIKVMDITGRDCTDLVKLNTKGSSIEMNIKNLPAGIYIIKPLDNQIEYQVEKFVKLK